MKLLINALLVVGFCLGTVGAAGFQAPKGATSDPSLGAWSRALRDTEENAKTMFVAGLAIVLVAGYMARARTRAEREAEHGSGGGLVGFLKERLESIRGEIVALDDAKESLTGNELRDRVEALLAGDYFDLGDRAEELAAALGFDDYARTWEGVATAERLLSRIWTMETDGFHDEAVLELPRARREIERAASAASSL